jgi:tRNA (cytosine34-C5)-methyltransferase
VYPHHQNTGGFFIALLEKKGTLPWQSQVEKQEAYKENTAKDNKPEPPKKKPRYHRGFKEDPFVFFDENEEIVPSIKKFYQLDEGFDPTNLLTRCTAGKKKNIYFCSPGLKDLVQNNEDHIKFINTGVKTFVRNDNKHMNCDFRLCQEGLESIKPYIGDLRRVRVQKEDLVIMLNMTDPTKPPDFESFSKTTQDRIKEVTCGSCILEYQDDKVVLNLVGWKGTMSLRAYIDQNETVHTLRLLGADLSKFERNKFQERKAAAEDVAEENEVMVVEDE